MSELYDVNDFWKFKMRVGLIKSAVRVPRTRKLIKLEVDFGDETRTVIAGVGDQYEPEDFTGKKMIFVTNLKPKKIAGVTSEAMLIVAEDETTGKVYLITLGEEVPIGCKVW